MLQLAWCLVVTQEVMLQNQQPLYMPLLSLLLLLLLPPSLPPFLPGPSPLVMVRNRSCPAVSQICSFTHLLSKKIFLILKSILKSGRQ
jgi:hypothetical protein